MPACVKKIWQERWLNATLAFTYTEGAKKKMYTHSKKDKKLY